MTQEIQLSQTNRALICSDSSVDRMIEINLDRKSNEKILPTRLTEHQRKSLIEYRQHLVKALFPVKDENGNNTIAITPESLGGIYAKVAKYYRLSPKSEEYAIDAEMWSRTLLQYPEWAINIAIDKHVATPGYGNAMPRVAAIVEHLQEPVRVLRAKVYNVQLLEKIPHD